MSHIVVSAVDKSFSLLKKGNVFITSSYFTKIVISYRTEMVKQDLSNQLGTPICLYKHVAIRGNSYIVAIVLEIDFTDIKLIKKL